MASTTIEQSQRFATVVTIAVHGLLLLFALWFTISNDEDRRSAFIEVELGEFKSGTMAEFSKERREKVATRPDPSETEVDDPKETPPEPEEVQQTTTEETTKPVDLPDQTDPIEDPEVIKTPDTEKIEPQTKSTEEQPEEVEVPPETRKEEDVEEGEKESGDVRGTRGDTDADQGTGTDKDKSAPYELKWEGDIERAPQVQPLPDYTADVEAVITVRFEVKPNGSVGRVIPLKKMNPELEKEVVRTLRSWRFSKLPSGVPQRSQWGTITFRFVMD